MLLHRRAEVIKKKKKRKINDINILLLIKYTKNIHYYFLENIVSHNIFLEKYFLFIYK